MGIFDDWADVFNNISTCRYEDAVLGILCCILLLLLRVSFSKQSYVEEYTIITLCYKYRAGIFKQSMGAWN
jgi:hypothetical protein